MSDVQDAEVEGKYSKTKRGGIKSVTFYGNARTNGVSHKKNKAKKKAQYLKNKGIRADLYSRKATSNLPVGEWHTTLAALSKGTA